MRYWLGILYLTGALISGTMIRDKYGWRDGIILGISWPLISSVMAGEWALSHHKDSK